MKKLLLYPFFLLALAMACTVDDPDPIPDPDEDPRDPDIVVPIDENTSIVFTPQAEAAERLGTSDTYTQTLSKFDLTSRTQNKESTEEEDYLTFASQQAQAWTAEEKTILEERILGIKEKIDALGLQLEFPEEILLIKSTMNEEGGAVSYTRENYIVVRGLVNESFLIHELFHILTRFKPEIRSDLFETIHFTESNRISYPEGIRDLVITNPDAPFLEHTITVEIDGESEEVVFILISEEEWDGGSFFTYLKQRLMFVEGPADEKQATLVDDMPILRNFAAAADLEQKIGTNTEYTLHPEEILAEHFVMLVLEQEVPEPSYIDAMKVILQQP
ncbi:hypothetical protein [Cyclobacterium jeungdonense]|uniref:DUF4157 domain-containing protein n=1 Tax=Cyclobacterium jeungdonense TaxID=708087 RepID=A0ABT8CDD5_9BACT|nr:hypothetical protein [Cyclobacterium jeungdonense]MDN3689563.1 hypothetical protein [Cyclobacterium jeungdonense]